LNFHPEIKEGIMKEFIEFIAKKLVDNPDAVDVSFIEGKNTAIIELRVAPEDVGKVIGKSGRTANALRTLLSAVASRQNQKIVLEIIEEKK
jgi:uncharacterized protein